MHRREKQPRVLRLRPRARLWLRMTGLRREERPQSDMERCSTPNHENATADPSAAPQDDSAKETMRLIFKAENREQRTENREQRTEDRGKGTGDGRPMEEESAGGAAIEGVAAVEGGKEGDGGAQAGPLFRNDD